jgi:heme a synthase
MNKFIKYWLIAGLLMVLVQVVIGGITRITGSGLSITKWEIVTGTLPPLNEEQWESEFELYKMTPQYREINEGMAMADFKFIYFWEYFHRLWARLMGFVFIIPFCIFLLKRQISIKLGKDLLIVFGLATMAASFGWIMVASGLIERPWVNAYKLSIHLMIAFTVFLWLLWTYYKYSNNYNLMTKENVYIKPLLFLIVLLWIQIFLGGIMSGMKAAVVYPTWPDIGGSLVPDVLTERNEWSFANFSNYDKNEFMPAFVHFFHRGVAYIILIMGLILSTKMLYDSSMNKRRNVIVFLFFLVLQIMLGILTVVNSKGNIPLLLGVLHQGVGLLLLASCYFLFFVVRRPGHKLMTAINDI